MSALTAVSTYPVSRLMLFTARYPEWWVLAICAAAWGTMMAGASHSHVHAGSDAMRLQVVAWMLMTVAMMLPTVIPQIRRTAQGSFWHRRHRAIAGFVVGFLLPWVVLGLLASFLLGLRWTHTPAVPVALFVVAAAWQRTRTWRLARRDCHRTIPLAPLGWRADRDCLRYGCMVGTACVRSCWPLMLACAATGHGFIAMAGGCLLALLEGWSPRPSTRILAAGTLGLALFYALLWGSGTTSAHPSMHM